MRGFNNGEEAPYSKRPVVQLRNHKAVNQKQKSRTHTTARLTTNNWGPRVGLNIT
jgi:hypothetical protein